jgi:hypothetical protein
MTRVLSLGAWDLEAHEIIDQRLTSIRPVDLLDDRLGASAIYTWFTPDLHLSYTLSHRLLRGLGASTTFRASCLRAALTAAAPLAGARSELDARRGSSSAHHT